ncbi:MAG: (Fe-S)-binding protein [Lamprobacter sp.]|uniref:(Fe-S)-binding protein n=1 Tax=Lamprobacter sp. TaxID=3100796 RepID=UPI002B25CB41|nr:(Fe-S)-binding protein [Lamprobacter sp.]MEA3639609.1 (Fe-S)-binding protein [Lamprobacter sp.]
MSDAGPSGVPSWPKGADECEIEQLLRLADQCVKCGYCLPHCPTFKLAQDEGESPRGRIALIQGLLTGAISDGPRVQRHLDQCLECRACEPACPSLVRYGALMDGARAVRAQHRSAGQPGLRRLRLALLTRPAGLRLVAGVGILYRWLRLPPRLIDRLSKRWPAIQVLDPLAKSLRWPRRRLPSSAGEVALFRGCVAQLTDQPLEAAALRLLTRLGYPPRVPNEQVCCGAMHRHNGYPAEADQQLALNAQVFAKRPVIGLASACVAELREHGQAAGHLNAIEICRFLLDQPWPVEARLNPLPVKVAVHEPCSHRNQLGDQAAVYQLLQRIPELSLTPLPGNETCCGAAGTYLTEHPEIALALAAPKIDALERMRPDYLVTTNTGCALHLAARIRHAGLATQVLHPIQLIERQLSIQPQTAKIAYEQKRL